MAFWLGNKCSSLTSNVHGLSLIAFTMVVSGVGEEFQAIIVCKVVSWLACLMALTTFVWLFTAVVALTAKIRWIDFLDLEIHRFPLDFPYSTSRFWFCIPQ